MDYYKKKKKMMIMMTVCADADDSGLFMFSISTYSMAVPFQSGTT